MHPTSCAHCTPPLVAQFVLFAREDRRRRETDGTVADRRREMDAGIDGDRRPGIEARRRRRRGMDGATTGAGRRETRGDRRRREVRRRRDITTIAIGARIRGVAAACRGDTMTTGLRVRGTTTIAIGTTREVRRVRGITTTATGATTDTIDGRHRAGLRRGATTTATAIDVMTVTIPVDHRRREMTSRGTS